MRRRDRRYPVRALRRSLRGSGGGTLVSSAAVIAIVMLAGPFLSGCAGSSPRFRTSSSGKGDDDESRYAAKIREEESREDDRKVDVQSLKKKYSTRSADNALAPPGLSRDAVLLDVVSFLGVPYKYGGVTKSGIDCSGFTGRVYEHAAGIVLPRSAEGQYHVGRGVKPEDLRFGDLVFFNTTGDSPSHVGIYIEDDLFAHASVTSGVTLSSLQSTYYRERFVGARRVVP